MYGFSDVEMFLMVMCIALVIGLGVSVYFNMLLRDCNIRAVAQDKVIDKMINDLEDEGSIRVIITKACSSLVKVEVVCLSPGMAHSFLVMEDIGNTLELVDDVKFGRADKVIMNRVIKLHEQEILSILH